MPRTPAEICVLLSTWNGERFLGKQLDSLHAQTHENWRLIVRDDGSSDKSVETCQKFGKRRQKVELIEDDLGRLGPAQSYGQLLHHADDARYFAFCDQDDIWEPTKLETCLNALRQAEAEHGAETPLLVCSDLKIIDAQDANIHPSFWELTHNTPPKDDPLGRLLAQNFVVGSAMLINAPLAKIATPIPKEAMMHDWWLALCAAAWGRVITLPEPLVHYRQHEANATGGVQKEPTADRAKRSEGWLEKRRRRMEKRHAQARALEQRALEMETKPASLPRLQSFNQGIAQGGWAAVQAARKNGVRMSRWSRNLLSNWLLYRS